MRFLMLTLSVHQLSRGISLHLTAPCLEGNFTATSLFIGYAFLLEAIRLAGAIA